MFRKRVFIYGLLCAILFMFCVSLISGCGGGGSNVAPTPPTPPAQPSPRPSPFPTPTPTPVPTPTPTPTPVPRDLSVYSVSIGIAAYLSSPLAYTALDATAFNNAFKSCPSWQGAKNVVLRDTEALKFKIEEYIQDAAARLKEDGLFVFYYSGHGTNLDGEGYFILLFNSVFITQDQLISATELQSYLEALPAGCKKLVVLDTCFSGSFIGKSMGFSDQGVLRSKFLKLDGSDSSFKGDIVNKSIETVPNLVAITSSTSGQESFESNELKSGVMTYYLLEGVGTGASLGPAKGLDNYVTGEEAYIYAKPKVLEYVFRLTEGAKLQSMQTQNNYPGLIIKDQ